MITSNANSKDSQRKTPILKSVDKAFEILSCFTHETPDYTINELARKLKVSKGTVHRVLLTAQKAGFIEQNGESGRYQLGMKIFELSSVITSRMNLRTEALPYLKKLTELTGETSYIVVQDGYEAICIESVEGHNFLRVLFLEVGKRMPLYIGAGPKILLAGMSDEEIEKWMKKEKIKAWTNQTIIEKDKIWESVERVRKQGYAVSKEDVTDGASAIGAPIYNVEGKLVGSVSLSGASINFKGEKLEKLIDMVVLTGQQISQRLGYMP